MAVPWLLIAVLGLAANEVSCQNDPNELGADPPPLPTKGVRLFQGVLNRTIPNYAMIAARDFADRDGGIVPLGFLGGNDGVNDGVWCQSAMNVGDIGSWKFPDGSAVSDDLTVTPIHMANRPGQVGLLRQGGIGSSPYQGMYTCTIPDENGITQTLVIWAAGNGAYDGGGSNPIPNPLIESATDFNWTNQSRDTDPPEFTLSFNVMVAPPTNVTCQVDGTPVEVVDLSRIVTAGLYNAPSTTSPVTNVTVTLRTRQAGNYQCTVSVYRASGNNLIDATSNSVPVTVTGTPTDFTAARTGLHTAFVSWTAPASNDPPVEGYEVFYESESGVRTSGANTTATQVNLTLSSLEPDVSYTAFVVAFGGDLPSAHSNYATIPAVVSVTFTTDGDSVAGSEFSITATVNISDIVDVWTLNITWLDSSGNEQNATSEVVGSGMSGSGMSGSGMSGSGMSGSGMSGSGMSGSGMSGSGMSELNPSGPVVSTLDLTFSSLALSQAGVYSIWIIIVDTYGNNATIQRSYPLIVQIKYLTIIVSDTTVGPVSGRYFASTPLSLNCSTDVPETVDVDNFTITEFWSGPGGPISSGNPNDRYIITPAAMQPGDSNTFVSTLSIDSLVSTGPDSDSGNYSCNMTLTLTGDYPYIQPPTASGVGQLELTVEEPPMPVLKIVPVGLPQIGTAFSLVCNVTTDEDLLASLSVNWFSDGTMVMNTTNRTISLQTGTSFITATLKFDPASMEDEGNYTCISALTIPGSTEPPLTVSDTTSVGTIGVPEVSISELGAHVAGEQYSLVCVVTVVGGLPTAFWQHNGENVTNGVTTTGEGTTTVTLTLEFNPLTYEDGGLYTCVGFSAVSNPNTTSKTFPFDVQVPAPMVGVTTSSNDTLYQATQQSLFCTVTFSNLLPSDGIDVTFEWYFQGTMVENGTRVTVSNLYFTLDPDSTLASSSITFSPINTTDSGNYKCSVGFSLVGSPANILPPGEQQESINVTVEEFRVPNVVITPMGDSTAGNNFTLTCAANNVIDNLEDMPELQWVNRSISSSSMNTLDLLFNPLRTSDGGVFTCRWTYTALGLSFSNQTSFNLAVNIPIIAVSVQTFPFEIDEGSLYEDTYVDLICNPIIPEAVDTAVNISFTWTAHSSNGASIEIRGDGYNITDQLDSSTLRIEQLTVDDDNMAVYSCLVGVAPISGSVFIVGSDSNMGNITLTVNALESDLFSLAISIPGIPTAGDNFTMTCIVTGPDRLVITPQLDWEVQINGMSPVPVTEAKADIGFVTIGDIVITGSAEYSRMLSFTTIRTSQARRYLCDVFVSGIISLSEFGNLAVQIPPPVVTVGIDPAVGPIYSSTAINLTCTAVLAEEVDTATMAVATWTDPNGGTNDVICQQPSDSRICVVEAVSAGENILVFYPVDFEKDNGLHTCDMTIISNTTLPIEDTLILDATNSGIRNISAQALPEEVPIVSVTASGSREVGQSLNLSCNVTLVERMVVSPGVDYNITWMKMDNVSQGVIGEEVNITTVTVMGDPTTTVTLTFDPLRFEDRGTYICMADLNVTKTLEGGEESEELDVIVDFPPVAVEVSMDYGDPLYAGTNLTLTCSTDLDENLIDIPVVLSTSWTRNNVPVITDSIHSEEQPSLVNPSLLTYTATYSFTPLDDKFDSSDVGSADSSDMGNSDMGNTNSGDMGDSGVYQCDLTVMPDVSDSFVRPRNGSNTSNNITVLALPSPTVDIVVNGTNILGQALSLTCVVGVIDRLVVQPEIVWEKYASSESVSASTISVNSSRNGNNSTLSFPFLHTSDAGLYKCRAILTIDSINVNVAAEGDQNITLQIPPPLLVLSQSRDGEDQLAGSNLTFTIDIVVDEYVDTPHIGLVSWTRDGIILANGGRITVSDVSDTSNSNEYQAQLVFSTLSSTFDSGVYTSIVSVNSNSTYLYVTSALPTTKKANINVTDPTLTEVAEGLENFEGVETGCVHSDLFDDVTLICNVSKPEEVIPDLDVTWLHDGTARSGDIQVLNGGATVTHTLRFDSSVADDSGNYTCLAKLVIPESPTITQSASIEIFFRSSRPPFIPTQVESNMTTTTANISWTVPVIAYTPENYTVTYNGLELQPETNKSEVIIGDPTNILVTDRMYFVVLEGLEEANTYNYTVNAINCNGTTSTEVMNFTTMPDFPSGTPRNCANSTFNARDVWLQWDEPMRALQNGQIQGYNLICSADGLCANLSANLSATQSSSNTDFTIDPVSPFTQYTCFLSAINEVGEGPSTQCIFTTQQDAPGGPPENLTSDRRIESVTFEWISPSCPNGIIRRYLFSITMENGTYTRELCANQTTMTVDGFNPFELYSVEVSASTRVNGTFLDGPAAMLEEHTLPDRSSPVRDLSVTRINSTSLYISFTTPSAPNGIIDNYIVNVNNLVEPLPNFTLIVSSISATGQFSATPAELSECVPYYITVYAENQVGRGLETQGINFTKQCEPTVAPENVRVMTTDDLSIRVSWDPVSLEQAQGFFMYRIIFVLVTTSTARRNGRQTPMDFSVDVPSSLTNFTVTSEHGYDPNSVYTVSVGLAVVNDDTGAPFREFPTSSPQDLDALITPTPSPPEDDDNTLIIIIACVVAAVLGVLVALAVVVIVCVLLRKKSQKRGGISLESNGKRKRKKDLFDTSIELSPRPVTVKPLDEPPALLRPPEETVVSEPGDQQEDEEETKQDLAALTERRMDEELMLERMKPISKICFHEHVAKMHVDSDKGFEEEYKSVPMETDSTSDVGHLDMNKVKNRFANIFPYDFSRIRLKQMEDVPGSDYINACYVDGYNRTDCYVAAQGPLPTTVGDFWRMIWENRVTNVVMLTGVVEAGKKKCEQYWPDKVGETLTTQNGLVVMLASSVPFSDYSIRSLRVTKPGQEGAQPLDVAHYHFTAWPDHGVPQFATSLISFIRRVQKGHDKDKRIPLLVHCSAGVGRTGTFILLDSMMDRLKVEDTVNVYEFLRSLRAKRMHMIQTQVQYVFIHDALDELITCGETDILASNLRAKVNRMNKMVPGKNISGFQEQFQLLEQVCYKPSESSFSDALQQYNSSKNRYEDKLPLNLTRPRLRPTGASGSDYINASFVDGYKMRNAYISTQGPLKSTVDDFWRMVWEFKSRNIVLLCRNVEEGEEKCYMFWPTKENEPVEYGKLKVTLQAQIPGDEFVTRKLHICNDKGTKVDKEGVVVTLFQYMTWSEHSHPSSSAHMIELVETLTRAQMNTGNRPITVMCNDGVGRSGAFICIHSQLDRLKTDGDVDVFKYLKTARTRRQGLVIELDHYVYCHEVLADYVEAFDPYANFKNL